MRLQKVRLTYKGKKFELKLRVCKGFEKGIGLMFSRREKAKPLLFEFKELTKVKIHSFFVFFPFIALWLDDKNKIIDSKLVKPFTFTIVPERKFKKLIEIPLNSENLEIAKILVGKEKI